MTDFDTIAASFERYRKALTEANTANKTVVFDALSAAGITSVTAEFDGEGDSGQIESVIACSGDAHVPLPATPLTLHHASWQNDRVTRVTSPLAEAIEALCYGYLEQEHGGWENNDGAFGSFEFDVAQRTIRLEFNGRFTDVATHNHDF